jgi:hypothetical protein
MHDRLLSLNIGIRNGLFRDLQKIQITNTLYDLCVGSYRIIYRGVFIISEHWN